MSQTDSVHWFWALRSPGNGRLVYVEAWTVLIVLCTIGNFICRNVHEGNKRDRWCIKAIVHFVIEVGVPTKVQGKQAQ